MDMFLWGLFRFHDAALMREAHFFVPGVRWQPPPWPRLVFHATRPGSPGKGTRFYGVERVILAKFCLLIDLCLAQDSGLLGLQKPLRLSASSPPTVRLGRRPLCCRAQSRKMFSSRRRVMCHLAASVARVDCRRALPRSLETCPRRRSGSHRIAPFSAQLSRSPSLVNSIISECQQAPNLNSGASHSPPYTSC